MRQLEHVDVAHGNRLVKLVAGHTIEEVDLPRMRETRNFEQMTDFRFACPVKDRRSERDAFAEAFGILQQFVVAELREGLPDRGIRKYLAEPAADGLSPN